VYGVLLLLVALGSGLLVHALLGNDNDLIKPPDVVGLSQQQAVQQLASFGLGVDEVVGRFDGKPVGTVLEQSPDANFFIRRGGSVDLTVSRGLELTTVPQVIGISQPEAEAALQAAKLTVKVIPRDGNVPAGQVLDTIPKPGTRLRAGEGVSIVVASGNVQVPDVRGLPQDQAIAALGQAGFAVGLRSVLSTAPPGTVVAQTPVNALAPRGSDVVLDVATAAPAPTPAPTP
jgi:serine/threonine-protein kinase